MRKKILRSRSGFEKPESREEAIMQNILGASNVLDPAESNIEEILQAILYNTPYTKEAEFEIEKILLAIKNNGTYDGEGEGRDIKILIAILNDLDYTEETESRIEELFIEWLHQRSSIKVLEGVPPLTFVAKGNPLINYEISGNTVQSGTPTPDSPIMPQGTGDKTANLFDKAWFNNNTQLSLTTGLPIGYEGRIAIVNPIDVSNIDAVTLTYSLGITVVENFMYSIFSGNTLIKRVAGKKSGDIIDVTNADTLYICLYIGDRNITVNDVQWIMLNTGSTALPYEPYGYKIPISSASTATPVYLGEVETTRRVKKLMLTGEEDYVVPNISLRVPIGIYVPAIPFVPLAVISSHFQTKNSSEGTQIDSHLYTTRLGQSGGIIWFFVPRDFFSGNLNVDNCEIEYKEWLRQQYAAGTPVTVWYVLATEETGIVNEPLMRIGDYADTLSMEQAGVQIPTNNGTTVIDVDTTVKPSNIYIEYK